MDLNTTKTRNTKVDKRNTFFKIFNVKSNKNLNRAILMNEKISDTELMEGLNNAKKEWLEASLSFEYVDDKDIIDYYTYKILACQIRYEYFLKLAKEKGTKGEALAQGH